MVIWDVKGRQMVFGALRIEQARINNSDCYMSLSLKPFLFCFSVSCNTRYALLTRAKWSADQYDQFWRGLEVQSRCPFRDLIFLLTGNSFTNLGIGQQIVSSLKKKNIFKLVQVIDFCREWSLGEITKKKRLLPSRIIFPFLKFFCSCL